MENKIKEIFNVKGDKLREVEMTEEEAGKFDKVIEIDVTDGTVLCDSCGDDYTTSNECGGITMGSWAVCPKCAPRVIESAKKYNEEQFLGHRCPPGMAYADWVRDVLRKKHRREGQETIIIKMDASND